MISSIVIHPISIKFHQIVRNYFPYHALVEKVAKITLRHVKTLGIRVGRPGLYYKPKPGRKSWNVVCLNSILNHLEKELCQDNGRVPFQYKTKWKWTRIEPDSLLRVSTGPLTLINSRKKSPKTGLMWNTNFVEKTTAFPTIDIC